MCWVITRATINSNNYASKITNNNYELVWWGNVRDRIHRQSEHFYSWVSVFSSISSQTGRVFPSNHFLNVVYLMGDTSPNPIWPCARRWVHSGQVISLSQCICSYKLFRFFRLTQSTRLLTVGENHNAWRKPTNAWENTQESHKVTQRLNPSLAVR